MATAKDSAKYAQTEKGISTIERKRAKEREKRQTASNARREAKQVASATQFYDDLLWVCDRRLAKLFLLPVEVVTGNRLFVACELTAPAPEIPEKMPILTPREEWNEEEFARRLAHARLSANQDAQPSKEKTAFGLRVDRTYSRVLGEMRWLAETGFVPSDAMGFRGIGIAPHPSESTPMPYADIAAYADWLDCEAEYRASLIVIPSWAEMLAIADGELLAEEKSLRKLRTSLLEMRERAANQVLRMKGRPAFDAAFAASHPPKVVLASADPMSHAQELLDEWQEYREKFLRVDIRPDHSFNGLRNQLDFAIDHLKGFIPEQ